MTRDSSKKARKSFRLNTAIIIEINKYADSITDCDNSDLSIVPAPDKSSSQYSSIKTNSGCLLTYWVSIFL